MSERKYHEEPAKLPKASSGTSPTGFEKKKVKEFWNIEDLESFFAKAKLPAGPVMLDGCTKIINVELFVSASLQTIKVHNGNKTYFPYYERLLRLKEIIKKQKS
jgi:hypothetical protein